MRLHPFEIPELLEPICQLFDTRDFLTCTLVCKKFHNALVPFLWRKIVIAPALPIPTKLGLKINKQYIQEFVFRGLYPSDILELQACSRLQSITMQSLSVHGSSVEEDRILYGIANLIAAHGSTIKNLNLDLHRQPWGQTPSTSTPPRVFWTALAACSKLDSLILCNIEVQRGCMEKFFQVWSIARSLSLNEVVVSKWSANHYSEAIRDSGELVLERSRELTISPCKDYHFVLDDHYHSLATLLRKCINLESLVLAGNWHPRQDLPSSNVADFCGSLVKDTWPLPKLNSLALNNLDVEDRDLAAVMQQLNVLKVLAAVSSGFGPLSLQALIMNQAVSSAGTFPGMDLQAGIAPGTVLSTRKLSDTIESLDLLYCSSVTSYMVQVILTSCPSLTSFYAPEVTVADIARGGDWACTGMMELELHIKVDYDLSSEEDAAMQRLAFARLGKLSKLKILGLTHGCSGEERTLDLRRSAGLDLLSGLTSLSELYFESDYEQQMGVEEAQWIVENWTALVSIEGVMNWDWYVAKAMMEILKLKGVRSDSNYYNDHCLDGGRMHPLDAD
ncbi:hypothetical protein EDD11_008596 [Mortierella claussenii]|nr:hypothetical protein EDD11_008596 [Mortierella claussenii]